MKLLQTAAEIVGGNDELARRLGIGDRALEMYARTLSDAGREREWLAQARPVGSEVATRSLCAVPITIGTSADNGDASG